jgi:hypothetical protein
MNGPSTPRAKTVALAAGLLAGAALLFWWSRPSPPGAVLAPEVAELPALPHRVTVQVLNGTRVGQLAASVGMGELRRLGLDVVSSGNATTAQREAGATLILVRRGDTTGVGRILARFPKAIVRDEPMPSLLVDLTVVLGPDATPERLR